ncbi:MAG: hypothetical protein Q9203_006812 [Teloschistes exilis]
MQSKLAVVVLAALASVVSSSPLASPKVENASNQLVGPAPAPDAAADLVFFTVCIDANHSGRCESLSSQRGACYNLYNGFDKSVSSVYPNGATCSLYKYAPLYFSKDLLGGL